MIYHLSAQVIFLSKCQADSLFAFALLRYADEQEEKELATRMLPSMHFFQLGMNSLVL